MFKNSQSVTDDPNTNGVAPNPAMSKGEGVPSGMPQQVGNDAMQKDDASVLKEQLLQREQDLRRLQSALDSRMAQREREWREERSRLETQLDEIAKRGLDETELIKYEAQRAKERAAQLEQELQGYRVQQEQVVQMNQYAEAFSGLGVDRSKLDMSSPEALVNSGWAAVADLVTQLRSNSPQPQANPGLPQSHVQSVATSNGIVTGSGSAPRSKPTYTELKASLEGRIGRQVTWDEFFSAAERGQVDLNQLI